MGICMVHGTLTLLRTPGMAKYSGCVSILNFWSSR